MPRFAVAVAAVALLCGCGSSGPVTDRTGTTSSSTAQPASPRPLATPSPSPLASPWSVAASAALLIFIRPGAVSLVRPDGTVVSTIPTTKLDSDELARYEFELSDAALIGHVWGPAGEQLPSTSLSLYRRDGTITPLAPAAAKFLSSADMFNSPIAIGGHNVLVTDAISPEIWRYVRLDLTTGAVTVLLTATWSPQPAPPGAMDGPLPSSNSITPLGTSRDGSIARLMVTDVVVGGTAIKGQAYFDIDLRSLRVTGPHALPNVGPIAMSSDGRYIAWSGLRVVSGNGVRDLHIRDLTTDHETTVVNVPFSNEAAHGGVRFSPDNSYVALEGYGEAGMGFAVYDFGGRRLVLIGGVRASDEPNDNVPLWWTDGHTIAYQTTDATATRSGHSLDVTTGVVLDYPAALGAPVLLLAGERGQPS